MDHALLQIGAVDVPIYPTMTEDDYEYIFNHSESIYCFVSNDELYDKVSNVLDKCPTLKKVYSFEKYEGRNHWSEVTKLGTDPKRQSEVEDFMSAVKPEDLATIIYTSGTTGLPKRCNAQSREYFHHCNCFNAKNSGLTKGQQKH